MQSEDDKFEQFLRQFRPRQPRPLPLEGLGRPRRWMAATAAGVALIAVIGWALLREPSTRDTAEIQPEEGVLSVVTDAPGALIAAPVPYVVNWNIDALDRMLTEMSPLVLPDVERPDRTLHALAQE